MDAFKLELPKSALTVLDVLESAEHEAYLVGGCVRDALLGIEPHDWDITTSARPDEVKRVCEDVGLHTFDTGIAHGTVTVLADHESVEVTTYRAESTYSDMRHPDEVVFIDHVEGDLSRRDFTVNAMAYNPVRGLVDLFDGRGDLERGVLRAVGDPRERFSEDALRIMRALRFAATYGLTIEPATATAIHELASLLEHISAERIASELYRLLMGEGNVQILREFRDVIAVFIPELEPCFDFDQQNPYHIYDVYEHMLHALEVAPEYFGAPERLALLIHDIAKPQCFFIGEEDGIGHAYGHEKASADIARDICNRLKLSNDDKDLVVHLVRNHMFHIPDTPKLMRRFLLKHGEERARLLFDFRICDKTALGRKQPADSPLVVAFAKAQQLLEEQLNAEPVFGMRDLAINGRDLIDMGVEPGPAIGRILQQLLDEVVDGDTPNTRDILIARAATIRSQAES